METYKSCKESLRSGVGLDCVQDAFASQQKHPGFKQQGSSVCGLDVLLVLSQVSPANPISPAIKNTLQQGRLSQNSPRLSLPS